MSVTINEPGLLLPGDVPEEEWRAARRAGIGASEVAAVLGVSKWDGPLVVYGKKVHGYESPVSDAMEIGTELEPWVVRKFASRHPELAVVPKPGLFRGEKPWHLATPDAIATPVDESEASDLVEAKTACRYAEEDPDEGWGDPGTDEIPFEYLTQVTWACRIRGLVRWHVPVLFLDNRSYAEFSGDYSPELGDQLATRIDAWWLAHIVAGVEPRADRFDSTRVLLNYRHNAPAKSEAQLPEETRRWAAEYLDLRDQRGDINKEMAERANLLRQAHVAAGCEVGKVGDTKISTLSRDVKGTARLLVKDSAR